MSPTADRLHNHPTVNSLPDPDDWSLPGSDVREAADEAAAAREAMADLIWPRKAWTQ